MWDRASNSHPWAAIRLQGVCQHIISTKETLFEWEGTWSLIQQTVPPEPCLPRGIGWHYRWPCNMCGSTFLQCHPWAMWLVPWNHNCFFLLHTSHCCQRQGRHELVRPEGSVHLVSIPSGPWPIISPFIVPVWRNVLCFAYGRWFPNECQITIKLKCLHQTLEQASVLPAVKYVVALEIAKKSESGFRLLRGRLWIISITDLARGALVRLL